MYGLFVMVLVDVVVFRPYSSCISFSVLVLLFNGLFFVLLSFFYCLRHVQVYAPSSTLCSKPCASCWKSWRSSSSAWACWPSSPCRSLWASCGTSASVGGTPTAPNSTGTRKSTHKLRKTLLFLLLLFPSKYNFWKLKKENQSKIFSFLPTSDWISEPLILLSLVLPPPHYEKSNGSSLFRCAKRDARPPIIIRHYWRRLLKMKPQ